VSVQLGNVTVTFDNVTAPGNTTLTPIIPGGLPPLPGQYTLAGTFQAYEITTTATYTGNITVCLTVSPAVGDRAIFNSLRVLHGEGSPASLVDRTVLPPDAPAPDFSTQTICARVTSLSPFALAVYTPAPPSSIPFATFSARAQIDLGSRVNDDRFAIEGLFTLGAGSNGIDPLTEAVTVQLGSATLTIPAGSFRRNIFGGYSYSGSLGTTRLAVALQRLGGAYGFVVGGDRADLTGIANPVAVKLEIGGDAGNSSVRAVIR
jgi:hypothetical protein